MDKPGVLRAADDGQTETAVRPCSSDSRLGCCCVRISYVRCMGEDVRNITEVQCSPRLKDFAEELAPPANPLAGDGLDGEDPVAVAVQGT